MSTPENLFVSLIFMIMSLRCALADSVEFVKIVLNAIGTIYSLLLFLLFLFVFADTDEIMYKKEWKKYQ